MYIVNIYSFIIYIYVYIYTTNYIAVYSLDPNLLVHFEFRTLNPPVPIKSLHPFSA